MPDAKSLVHYTPLLEKALRKALGGPDVILGDGSRRRGRNSMTDSSPGGEGGAMLVVITQRPPGGFGPATAKAIKLADNGTWTADGDDIPVVIPKM